MSALDIASLAYKLDSKPFLGIVDESLEHLEYLAKSKSQYNIGEKSGSSHNLVLNDIPHSANPLANELDSYENHTLH